MHSLEWKEVKLEVDEDGFLQQPELWDERMALALAAGRSFNGNSTENGVRVQGSVAGDQVVIACREKSDEGNGAG